MKRKCQKCKLRKRHYRSLIVGPSVGGMGTLYKLCTDCFSSDEAAVEYALKQTGIETAKVHKRR